MDVARERTQTPMLRKLERLTVGGDELRACRVETMRERGHEVADEWRRERSEDLHEHARVGRESPTPARHRATRGRALGRPR